MKLAAKVLRFMLGVNYKKVQCKSAASTAPPYSVTFQAMIKAAASAASPKAKSRKPRPRGAPRRRLGWRMTPRGAPLGLGSFDLAFGYRLR